MEDILELPILACFILKIEKFLIKAVSIFLRIRARKRDEQHAKAAVIRNSAIREKFKRIILQPVGKFRIFVIAAGNFFPASHEKGLDFFRSHTLEAEGFSQVLDVKGFLLFIVVAPSQRRKDEEEE
jgi:hypothetical protein